ncbi:hypothetical protein JOM56_006690 [Amanita muscaria]
MEDNRYPMSTMHSRTSSPRLDASAEGGDTETLLGQSERYMPRPGPRLLGQKMEWRHIYYFLGAVFLLLVFSTLMYKTRTHGSQADVYLPTNVQDFDRLSAVIGPPTTKFRDNLKPDQKYITSWIDAGWTNDVITYMNLIYLALVTQRIPIIGSFIPSHLGNVPPIDFSKVFDVPRLSKLINVPVLEWHEVKDRNSTGVDELGCWDIWSTTEVTSDRPRGSRLLGLLNIDVSYTKTPAWVKVIPNFQHDRHSSLFALASLAEPETRLETLIDPVIHESERNRVRLPPDEHLLCYDYLYYVSTHFPFEYEYDYSPAWKYVGQHMHWSQELEKLTNRYLRRAMNLEISDEPPPPYVSIHARHRDFEVYCQKQSLEDCYASLDVIERRVEDVQQELRQRKGIDVKHVVMTSDERNSTWWDDVKGKGWYALDHSQTTELYGPWYPVLIDAVVQSNGAAFLGTDVSTMSTMARRRVQSWHDGADIEQFRTI